MQVDCARETWLTLSQAADRLGVHPATLRRWADGGQIPALLTPGGHRRFAAADIERFTQENRHGRSVSGLEDIWAENALSLARIEVIRHPHVKWLSAFPEDDRQRKRALGRYLLSLLLRYVNSAEKDERLVEEARALGRAHAENTLGLGMPSCDALCAAIFFQNVMIEAAMHMPETTGIRREAHMKLVRRIHEFLNIVQLAVAERYDQAKR